RAGPHHRLNQDHYRFAEVGHAQPQLGSVGAITVSGLQRTRGPRAAHAEIGFDQRLKPAEVLITGIAGHPRRTRNGDGDQAKHRMICVAVARGKAMADWKKLTGPTGDAVYLNLDAAMIGMQRNPDINITFSQSVSDPRVNIEVRETPDEILSPRPT